MSCSRDTRSGKYLRISESENIDRLSRLPDCVIGRILSCLPTKNAIQTCVLSRSWEYKWTFVSKIKIDERMKRKRSNEVDMISYVNRILLLSPSINCFTFYTHENYNINHLVMWMSALFRRNVENVRLYVRPFIYNPEWVVLPRSFLACTSLSELMLDLQCTVKVPHKISFINLTKLGLTGVQFLNVNPTTNTLDFSFPVLKLLDLRYCRWLEVMFVEIYAPLLHIFFYGTAKDEIDVCIIKIIGGRQLSSFQSYGPFPENIVYTGLTVRSARIYCSYRETNITTNTVVSAGRLLNGFSDVCSLSLSRFAAVIIEEASASGISLPVYNMMRTLKLWDFTETEYKSAAATVKALLVLLHAAPLLECLTIEMKQKPTAVQGNDADNEGNEHDYDAVGSIPSCIVSHLKKIRLNHFESSPHQISLVRFFLEHCVQLKKVIVACTTVKALEEIHIKSSTFPRASTGVVEFISNLKS